MTKQSNNEDPRFHKAVERVLSSYVSHGGINHIEGVNLPSREVVVELLSDLHEVLFPGYFTSTALESRNVRYVVGQRLARIFSSLTSETRKPFATTPAGTFQRSLESGARFIGPVNCPWA